PPEEIYRRPKTRFVAGFLGAVNWIDGVGVRPEALRVAREARANGDRSRAAIVIRAEFLGNCVHAHLRLAGGEQVTAEVGPDEAFTPGEAVEAHWRAADEMVFS